MRLAPSYRSGRHYGAFMTIFVIALAFAVTAPLILPIAGVRSLPLLVPVQCVGDQCVDGLHCMLLCWGKWRQACGCLGHVVCREN